jgi:membrane fusion protein (multidrug efflux system)
VQITPQWSGTVISIGADDTDFVKSGQELVKLDTADAQVALDQAEAQLAQTVREVRSLYMQQRARWPPRSHCARRMSKKRGATRQGGRRRAAPCRTHEQRRGRQGRVQSRDGAAGFYSQRRRGSAGGLASARQQLATNQTLTDGTSPKRIPTCSVPAARVREAYIALHRTVLPRPSTAMSPSEAFRSVSALLRARR